MELITIFFGKISAINATTIQVTFDSAVTSEDLVNKEITVTAGDVTLTAAYASLADGKASFIITDASKKLVDATTYTVSADWTTISNDTFIAKIANIKYGKTFEKVTTGIVAGNSTDVFFSAKDQYGDALSLGSVGNITITGKINGMPLLSSEVATSVTSNGLLKVTTTKALAENDVLELTVGNKDAEGKAFTVAPVSYTVGKAATLVATDIKSITATYIAANGRQVSPVKDVLPEDQITLTADVRDQFNNPILDAGAGNTLVRWVVVEGKDLIDPAGALGDANEANNDTQVNTISFTAKKAGTLTVEAYNIANGRKATYTVQIGAAKLTTLSLTDENPATQYNNEVVKYRKISQNDGAVLTPDMIKFNVVAKTQGTAASDVVVSASLRGGTGSDKNDIVISAKTLKSGTYEVTPYVGTAFDAEDVIKAAKFDVVTTLNPVATKIDSITLPTLKVDTKQKSDLVVRNTHGEAIDVTAANVLTTVYKNGQVSADLEIEELDANGSAIAGATGATVVKALRFNATAAGEYTVRVSINGTVATYDISATSEATTLQSIELGANIVDNTIIANSTTPVYRIVSVKDNKGDEIIPDTTGWNLSVKKGTDDVVGFANLAYYKHDAKGAIVDATLNDAEGIAIKFVPDAASVKDFSADTVLNISLDNAAATPIQDTLNVTVKAKSAVKSITLADTNITVIPGAKVKKEIVVLDQYGKAIIDPAMVEIPAIEGGKVSAEVTYDSTAKKMYITYTGVATGNGTVVVRSVANNAIKATANVTVGDNTNIDSIAFDAYNYKIYNNGTDDAQDQEITLTYKVNGGTLDVPASAINVISDSNLVTVTKDGSTIKVKAKEGVNTAAAGIGDKDGVITISLLTANGKTTSIDLTFSDDASVVDKSSVVIKDTVDENKTAEGVQLVLGKDAEGEVDTVTAGQITLLGKDQYGVEKDVTASTTWASANESVATVDASGLVTAKGAGKTTVTGFYQGSLYTIEVEVTQALADTLS